MIVVIAFGTSPGIWKRHDFRTSIPLKICSQLLTCHHPVCRSLSSPVFKGNPLQGIPSNLMRGGDKAIFACWRAMCDSVKSRRFDVASTGMVDLPTQIQGMTWLEELNLSSNQLSNLSPFVCELASVRVINISNNRLGSIPPEIAKMKDLRSLDVRGNNIRQLPLELGFCTELRELKIDQEMIVMPSKEVMGLDVQAIMMYLRRLHDAITTLSLSLTGMGLANVPKEAWAMTEMQQLTLDKNMVSEIEGGLVFFEKLETFSCNLNQVADLNFLLGDPRSPPWDRQRLMHLTSFRMRGNDISKVPPEISRLKSLKLLQLDNNKLESLPDECGMIPSLQQLTVSRNALTMLPETLSALKNLNTLDVSYNKIFVLPFGLGLLDDLTKFIFSENPIRSPPLEVMRGGADHTLQYLAKCIEASNSQMFDCSSMSLYEIPREVGHPSLAQESQARQLFSFAAYHLFYLNISCARAPYPGLNVHPYICRCAALRV